MGVLLRLACFGLLAFTGCHGSEQQDGFPVVTTLSAAELLDRISSYYPRWTPDNESLERYIERYPETAEHAALKGVVAQALERNEQWRGFLQDVRSSLPGDFVQDAAPPWDTIPSYQVVIGYEHPPGSGGSRHLVFRLSHLAPVFDYHESDRDADGRRIRVRRTPSGQAAPLARLVTGKIAERFDSRYLAPAIGDTPVPGIHAGSLLPGKVTLGDALFGESPTW